jgi:hypothetical protein
MHQRRRSRRFSSESRPVLGHGFARATQPGRSFSHCSRAASSWCVVILVRCLLSARKRPDDRRERMSQTGRYDSFDFRVCCHPRPPLVRRPASVRRSAFTCRPLRSHRACPPRAEDTRSLVRVIAKTRAYPTRTRRKRGCQTSAARKRGLCQLVAPRQLGHAPWRAPKFLQVWALQIPPPDDHRLSR